MSEQIESPRNDGNASDTDKQPRRGRRWLLAGVAAAVVSTLSFVGISHANEGPGCRGHHHGMGMHHDPMDPEMAAKHIDGMINRLLKDGTPEQKAKVATIAKAAMSDLRPLREKHKAAREQAIKLLTQETIDRAALEQVRADELQLAEQVSKRLTQALADTAEVLTPAQRGKLAERMKKRMG